MNVYAIEYIYDPDAEPQMAKIRPQHRNFLTQLFNEGTLLIGGAWIADNHDSATAKKPGALLLMHTQSDKEALEILHNDPFYINNFIIERTIHRWNPLLSPFDLEK
ncbi:MAG: YciI family protein [Actinomycetaceae bacterium]|nr:YciI family protein [Actinomycetaceae bacterium]